MCGIVGWVSFGRDLVAERAMIDTMTETMACRGPDAAGVWLREHSTVALSGEAADEVFGGYRWFHDPEVQRADTFPWVAAARSTGVDATAVLNADLLADLDFASYLRAATADVLPQSVVERVKSPYPSTQDPS